MPRGIFLLPALLVAGATVLHATSLPSPHANYFIGADKSLWLRDQPMPRRAIALHARRPQDSAINTIKYSTFLGGGAVDHSAAVATDSSGNIYVTGTTRSSDFPVTPAVWQTLFPNVAFQAGFVAKFAADGSLLWCTFLGGGQNTTPTAIAVDRYGNSYITGTANSPYPTTPGVIYPNPTGIAYVTGASVFVTKLNTAGNALLYSTLFDSGSAGESATAIAVDNLGDSVVAGYSSSVELKATAGAVVTRSPVLSFAAKLNPAGTKFVYVTGLTSGSDAPAAIALDSTGNAIISGGTLDKSTRTTSAFQPLNGSRSLFKTVDYGASWTTLITGLENTSTSSVAVDPANGSIVYAAGSGGLFRSTNGGSSWSLLSAALNSIAIDPSDSRHLLLSSDSYGFSTSHDAGVTWSPLVQTSRGSAFIFDPSNPSNVILYSMYGLSFSRDGGDTFKPVTNQNVFSGLPPVWGRPAFDASVPGKMYANTYYGMYTSSDSGASWLPAPPAQSLLSVWPFTSDPRGNGYLYTFQNSYIIRTLHATSPVSGALVPGITDLAFDPTETTIYALTSAGLFSSSDAGATAVPAKTQPPNPSITALAFDLQHPGTFFASATATTDAFVTKISADGTNFAFSTYFGGTAMDSASCVAVDPAGDIYIAGSSNSSDLPSGTGRAAGTDTFVAKFSPDAGILLWSRYLGGRLADTASAIAVDTSGNVFIAGTTYSSDLPVTPDAVQSKIPGVNGAGFFARFDPAGNLLSNSYFGGAEGDSVNALTLDPAGRLILTGDTNSPELAVTPNAAQPVRNGYTDAFVAIFGGSR